MGVEAGVLPARDTPRRPGTDVPAATVARLPVYLRALLALQESGAQRVSSEALAVASGVTAAKVRKDLSHLGSYGTRGVGYPVTDLVEHVEAALGLGRSLAVVIVGIGNLGQALAGYAGFAARGFRVVALLDADPAKVGTPVGGLAVRSVADLDEVVATERARSGAGGVIGVIATPAAQAQAVCDRLVRAGVTGVLSFAPAVLTVPGGVDLREVDLATELQILSFHEQRKAGLPAATVPGVPA